MAGTSSLDDTQSGEAEISAGPDAGTQLRVLLAGILLAAFCALLYELLIGTVSSYLLGDSITQFSLTIGIFMFSMGAGSFLSRGVRTGLIRTFVHIEIALGVIGGLSVTVLYFAYAYTEVYQLVMILFIFGIGLLAGMEIPLVLRILRSFDSLRVAVANVLSLDYVGALLASLLFPFLLLPHLGVIRTSILTGILNLAIAWIIIPVFRTRFHRRIYTWAAGGTLILLALLVTTGPLVRIWESSLYEDRIIYSEQTPYQKIVMTRWKDDVRLFLNGALQFSSIDEYRYHEALVHPAMSLTATPGRRILVLGGGDGLATRELLKYPRVKHITLVDIDPTMTHLAKTNAVLTRLNQHAFSDPRVNVVNQDAYRWTEQDTTLYDVILCDLPDPNNQSLSKLYSREFYGILRHRLAHGGILVTQATSAYFAPHAFWSIVRTLESVGMKVYPYHTYIPTFGDWGFAMASDIDLRPSDIHLTIPTRYLTDTNAADFFVFPKDMQPPDVEPNSLNTHQLMTYYRHDWQRW